MMICHRSDRMLGVTLALMLRLAPLAVAAEEDQWPSMGHDSGGTYYSPLADINTTTVNALGFAWSYPLGTTRGLEATPLVVDGVMYAVGNWGKLYSLDAKSGRERWTYDPHVDGQWGRYACCDAVNRGIALDRSTLFVGALDGYLHAVDATTGQQQWKVDTLIGREQHLPYTTPGAPVVAGDVVVIGNAGADFKGTRGYVSAYDVKTGALKWRFFTVPRDPALGVQDQPHLIQAIKTWDPMHRWEFGGGGNVWDGMAYDPELNLIYVGTGNGSPYSIKAGGRHGGDDLYTASIIAIHADTGRIAWYYQTSPGDEWDYDSTQKMILTDLEVRGQSRHVLMQAAKNGFLYILDRKTGEFLSARNFAHVTWTKGLDPITGRPRPQPNADYTLHPKLVFPSMAGAHSWQPMSFNPTTQLVYIPVLESPMVYIETSSRRAGLIEGNFTVAGLFPQDYDPHALQSLYGTLPPLKTLSAKVAAGDLRTVGVLKAWDPRTQRLVWERPSGSYWNGGVLSTAGDIVVQGDARGLLSIYDARTGVLLKSIDVGTSIMAAPMTYRIDGTQYIAVMAGYGGATGLFSPFPKDSAAFQYGNAGRIVAFVVGGGETPKPPPWTSPPFPQPPSLQGTPKEKAHGELLYNRFCSRCHVFGRGVLPDLRRMSLATHALFPEIVLKGLYAAMGMGRWDDVLSAQDVNDIHTFLIGQSWDAYSRQSKNSAGDSDWH